MKIADFFVALGFQVQGSSQVKDVDKSMASAEVSAVKLLAGVGALNAGFYAMIHSATQAAVGLQKFVLGTSLSANELQIWAAAGKKANVEAGEIEATIRGLQKAQADIRLGQGNIAPWQFFGLSINQTPFEVLRKFHDVIQGMDPAVARTMAAQLGISENMFQFLRRSNLELDQFNRRLILTAEQQKNLQLLGRSWSETTFQLAALKNQFAATFAGPLNTGLVWLREGIDLLGILVERLSRATPAAQAMRWALAGIVATIGLLTLSLIPGAVEIGVIIGALLGLYLLWEDFQAALAGRGALFDWSREIAAVNALAAGLEKVAGWWRTLREIQAKNEHPEYKGTFMDPAHNKTWLNLLMPGSGSALEAITRGLDDLAGVPQVNGKPAPGFHQENHIDVSVSGDVGHPEGTARAIGREIKQAVSEASYQMPAGGY